MGKDVVVITRIEGNNEFKKSFKLENSPHQIEGFPIYFFDGNEFIEYDNDGYPDEEAIINDISEKLRTNFQNDEELYVCYHPGQEAFSITEELQKLDNITRVIRYSSVGRSEMTSTKIQDILVNPDSGSNIDDIIERVFGTKLEQKLNLLHACLTPAGAKEAEDNLSTAYSKIEKEVCKVRFKNFDTGEVHSERRAIDYLAGDEKRDCFDKDYINQLTHLRDELLNS